MTTFYKHSDTVRLTGYGARDRVETLTGKLIGFYGDFSIDCHLCGHSHNLTGEWAVTNKGIVKLIFGSDLYYIPTGRHSFSQLEINRLLFGAEVVVCTDRQECKLRRRDADLDGALFGWTLTGAVTQRSAGLRDAAWHIRNMRGMTGNRWRSLCGLSLPVEANRPAHRSTLLRVVCRRCEKSHRREITEQWMLNMTTRSRVLR